MEFRPLWRCPKVEVPLLYLDHLDCKTVVYFAGLLAKARKAESIGSLDTRALRT